ncbi:HK97 gp10 family phage protein [Clostridium sp.]|uniref:HK97 gp10 family phage protein n=1 Tax=Clostridium sp. TaxID=1506 RepID=UPI002FC5AC14
MSKFLELEGFDSFQKDLINVINKRYPQEAKKFMRKQANDVKKQAKDDTPIESGELIEHWKTSTKGKNKATANFIEAKVTNDAPHSHLVESGHMIKNGDGEYGYYPGVHMLEKAVIKKNGEFEDELHNFIDKALQDLKL